MARRVLRRARLDGNIARIPLTDEYEAVIDAADLHLVEGVNWFAQMSYYRDGSVRSVYAQRNIARPDKTTTLLAMHRVIMDPPRGVQVDHINGDGLDNRRVNLRLATAAENSRNRRMLTTNTSGVKGVYFNKLARKWQAHIKVNGVRVHLGMYSDLGAAAQAYAAASERYHGEFGLIAYKAPTETPETARQSALGVFG